jgi:hypothetical protein
MRGVLLAMACVLVASVAVGGTPTPSAAQIVPLPPLPPPPEGGNPLSDLLGPAATDGCDGVAVAFALAGPIATAQLPPDLAKLVDQISPYLSVATYACGFLAVPPSKQVCGIDTQLADAVGGLGLSKLGAPINTPKAAAVTYETAAGIENVFLRAGVDIGHDTSLRLAEALGCSIPPAAVVPPAKAPPSFAATSGSEGSAGSTSFVAVDLPGALGSVPTITEGRSIPAVTRSGPTRYPVDGLATLLLGLPLVLLGLGAVVAPRLKQRVAS